MDEDLIDYSRLKEDLRDYYGSAMMGPFPMAMMDLTNVENASNEELIEIARSNNVDLNNYQVEREKSSKVINRFKK